MTILAGKQAGTKVLNTIHTHNRLVALRKPILVLRALGTNFLVIIKTNIFQCSSKTELNELCFAFFGYFQNNSYLCKRNNN